MILLLITADRTSEGAEGEPGYEGHQLQHHWRSFGVPRSVSTSAYMTSSLTSRRLLDAIPG
jgi:hypothetical protein